MERPWAGAVVMPIGLPLLPCKLFLSAPRAGQALIAPVPVLQPHALAPQPPQVMARGAGNVLALQIKTNVRDLIGKTLV